MRRDRKSPLPDRDQQRYDVHCYVTVRIKLTGIDAPSPQAAARQADALFNWDEHRHQAEYVDEVTEFLVDVEGDADFSRSRQFGADFEPVET